MTTNEKISDYEIAQANSGYKLQYEVKEYIKKGWQPFGNIYETNGMHFQPMVKYTTQQKEAGDE